MRALLQDREEVVIVQRSRLGQLLVAFGLIAVAVSMLVLAFGSVVRSTSVAVDAAPDLIEVDVVRAPVETEIARAVVAALPPFAIDEDTAAAVASRMVRDVVVIEEISRASADAHRAWEAGDVPTLELDPAVLTPAMTAALRDIDLELARSLSDASDAMVVTEPIEVPVSDTSADLTGAAMTLGWFGFVAGLLAVVVGAVLDPHRDRTLHLVSNALLAVGAVMLVAPLLARLPDITSWGWRSAFFVAMVEASLLPLVIAGLASLGVGVFLRAVASQAAPSVSAKIAARERDAVTPPPAPTGAHISKRKGKKVRQEAIDAFFGPEEASSDDVDDDDVEPATIDTRGARDSKGRVPSGFDRAVDAVETELVDEEEGDGGDEPPDEESAEDDDAAARAFQERREHLERLDGRRNPLRTHLPR